MWIKKYLDVTNQGKWKVFFDLELEKYGGTVMLTSNLNNTDTFNGFEIKNCFIREVLSIWTEVNFEDQITSEMQSLIKA